MRTIKFTLAEGEGVRKGLGWIPDPHDNRDWTLATPKIQDAIKDRLKFSAPSYIDFRADFTEVEDQDQLGSCTAFAAVGLLECHIKQRTGMIEDYSKLFVYKATRNLLGWKGDTGAYMRSAMKALVLLGAPSESHWPYDISQFDEEPSAFVYALAQNHQALKYYRLDPPGKAPNEVVQDMKQLLAKRHPIMVGFNYYATSVNHETGEIAAPIDSEPITGGHAVVCAGYDDEKVIRHPLNPEHHTKGAFIIRNSWGPRWGEKGYGYLPYKYFLGPVPQARDCWALLTAEIMDEGKFDIP